MKKMIIVSVVLFLLVLSGCGKTADESNHTSTQSPKPNAEPAAKNTSPKSSSSSEIQQASDTISGVWLATGKEDGVSSTWHFNNGQLTINSKYHFSYSIAPNKDAQGYSVVTITNNEGKTHALLLERTESGFDGRTVEGKDYEHYLADGTVPSGQIIEYRHQEENANSQAAPPEEMEQLKQTLRTYIFDTYMKGPDYVYAKGINWSENFYDNLTAEEIWDVIEAFKEENNGEEGTLFDQAQYLSRNAPIKDNWKELFLENWNSGTYREDEIDKLVDNGDTVGVYTDSLPYTGEEDNYPFVTLDKRTGSWHG